MISMLDVFIEKNFKALISSSLLAIKVFAAGLVSGSPYDANVLTSKYI